jgi:hypothetical protein
MKMKLCRLLVAMVVVSLLGACERSGSSSDNLGDLPLDGGASQALSATKAVTQPSESGDDEGSMVAEVPPQSVSPVIVASDTIGATSFKTKVGQNADLSVGLIVTNIQTGQLGGSNNSSGGVMSATSGTDVPVTLDTSNLESID